MELRVALLFAAVTECLGNVLLESALGEVGSALSRAKRQAGYLAPSALVCPLSCMTAMSEQMNSVASEPAGLLSASLFEEASLSRFCRLYKKGKSCISRCPESQPREVMLKAFASLDYLCIHAYDELVSHLPCFKRSHTAVQAECNPKCGGVDVLKRLQKEQMLAQQLRDLDRMTQTMDKVCGVLDCQVDCQEPIIGRQCPDDPSAKSFMQGFARSSMLGTERVLEESGASRLWPEKCRRLARDPNAIGRYDPSDEYESYEEEHRVQELARETGPLAEAAVEDEDVEYLLPAPDDPASPTKTAGAAVGSISGGRVSASAPAALALLLFALLAFPAL